MNAGRADPGARCFCTSETHPTPSGPIILLRVAGEVDAFTAPVLRDALTQDLDQQPAHLVVDVAALTFCSARGIALLIEAGRAAVDNGTGYALSGSSRHLARMWALLWDDPLPDRYPSAAAAVTTLRHIGPG
ncbi:MAG: STAS domain-containing protein [Pseudonocardia sp.]|nr:STAS domain-containing protein [Pseudonocardia sp.]